MKESIRGKNQETGEQETRKRAGSGGRKGGEEALSGKRYNDKGRQRGLGGGFFWTNDVGIW